MKFIKIKSKHAQGILQPNSFRKYPFQRFPEKYKNDLRKEVWDLSKNSAGVTINFISNTSNLTARWTLKNQFKMHHMTDVGTSGIDLYQKKRLTHLQDLYSTSMFRNLLFHTQENILHIKK